MHAPSEIYDSLSPLQCQCHERDLEDALGGGGFTMNSGLNTNINERERERERFNYTNYIGIKLMNYTIKNLGVSD